jgi:hypothetical protein
MAVRPERVPAEEVRQRMLEAGRELALEAGAALTIEHLRLEEVIQRARVPRSSAYRMWAYREEYTDDLLCYLAGEGSWFATRPVLAPETHNVVRAIIAGNLALLTTIEGRRALLCEIVRVTASANYEALTSSTPWRLHMALVATLGSTRSGHARQRIATALEDAQRRSRESMVRILAELSGMLGLRLRDPAYSLDHVQLAGSLIIQSMALRNVQVRTALGGDAGPGASPAQPVPDAEEVNALLNGPIPGPGPHGEPVTWTLAAHVYLGVIDSFMELDPDFTPPVPSPVP